MELLNQFFSLLAVVNINDEESEDARLVAGVIAGDQKIMTELVEKYELQVRRHISSKLKVSRDRVDDVYQDAWCAVLVSLQRGRFDATKGRLGGFIWGITRNKILEFLGGVDRVGNKEVQVDPIILEITGKSTDRTSLEHEEQIKALRQCLKKLEERHAHVLNLRYYQEQSMKHIGELINKTEQQVIDLHRYALRLLTTCYNAAFEN